MNAVALKPSSGPPSFTYHPVPSPFLTRSQLLIRSCPLPIGKDIPQPPSRAVLRLR
jgi:hypothetical protein